MLRTKSQIRLFLLARNGSVFTLHCFSRNNQLFTELADILTVNFDYEVCIRQTAYMKDMLEHNSLLVLAHPWYNAI